MQPSACSCRSLESDSLQQKRRSEIVSIVSCTMRLTLSRSTLREKNHVNNVSCHVISLCIHVDVTLPSQTEHFADIHTFMLQGKSKGIDPREVEVKVRV